jgi:hypothetical protein
MESAIFRVCADSVVAAKATDHIRCLFEMLRMYIKEESNNTESKRQYKKTGSSFRDTPPDFFDLMSESTTRNYKIKRIMIANSHWIDSDTRLLNKFDICQIP